MEILILFLQVGCRASGGRNKGLRKGLKPMQKGWNLPDADAVLLSKQGGLDWDPQYWPGLLGRSALLRKLRRKLRKSKGVQRASAVNTL